MTDTNHPPEFYRAGRIPLVDMSPLGTAHFDAYVRLMEETEYAFLRSRGLSVVLPDERGIIGFPRLRADVAIHQWVDDQREVMVRLQVANVDGKQIRYEFQINDRTSDAPLIARGQFVVACCRFPGNRLPYAILIPDDVTQKLTAPGAPDPPHASQRDE